MPTREQDGSQTCVITTEHTLNTGSDPTGFKNRVVRLDLFNAALGDEFELRIKSKVRSGGTVREQHLFTFVHDLAQAVIETPPFATDGVTVTLKQTAGTGRVVTWEILDLA